MFHVPLNSSCPAAAGGGGIHDALVRLAVLDYDGHASVACFRSSALTLYPVAPCVFPVV